MKRLLYVDDEENNLVTLEVAFRKWYKVFTCDHPAKAMDIISEQEIKVVITDQRMPGLSGLELAKKINMIFPNVIIIILTAYDDNEAMLSALNQGGIYRYLLKPWDIKDLRQTIESAFETCELKEKNINLINNLLSQNQKLVSQERKYRLLFENSNDAIIIFENSKVAECNFHTFKMFGCDFGYLAGKTPDAFSPDRQPDGKSSSELVKELFENVNEGVPRNFEWQHQRPTGEIFTVSVGLNLMEKKGGSNYVQAVLRDITGQKAAEERLRESEEKYRLIFENSPQGIAHFNNNATITSYNSNFAEIMCKEIPHDSLVGLGIANVADKRLSAAVNKVIADKAPVSYESIYKCSQAKKGMNVRIQITPIKNESKVDGGVLIIEDLSDKIKQEELKKQIAVVKESARFKQNFLANMSHEIRTPLTGVIGMIDILEQTSLSRHQIEYLQILRQSGEDLREIINQVLDFSKIEAGKVSLKTTWFPVNTLFEKAHKLFQSICRKSIAFQTRKDPNIPDFIMADEVRIMQIVNNLVSNAVKFTDQGTISMQSELVSLDEDTGQCKIKILIADTGKGISKEQQELLFTPFTQVDDLDTRKFEGTGLGLSICKELARLHGGETGLVSEKGKGSTFWFTFLADLASSKGASAESTSVDGVNFPQGLKVLLAEDKKINQKVFTLMLTSMGYEVTIAQNGQEAIDLYKPGKFDIILMDIQMPEMNGITATQKIKSMDKNPPPIIGLSANAFEGDREKYMHLGMDEYVTKPLKKEDLIKVLNRFVFPEK